MAYRASRSPLTWLGGLLALYLIVPIAAFFVRLAGSDQRGFDTPGLWPAVWVSVEAATITTLLVALFGIPLANWLARSRGSVARAVGVLVLLPLALPSVMSGVVLIYLVGPYTHLGQFFGGRLTDSVVGLVLAQTFEAAPFLIIAARSAFEAIDPALDDIAASLGHRSLARFWLVRMRIAMPGIRAGALMTWLRALGAYGAVIFLAYHPFSLPVFTFVQFSSTGVPGTLAPTALVLAAAAVVVLLSLIRRPARRRPSSRLPSPRQPGLNAPTVVGFDLDLAVDTFRMKLNHQASSHRIAILGPSGAGKSIALRALAGFLGPHTGQVRFNGQLVSGTPVEDRHIGYVPQSLGLFPGRTVWQQVLSATDADPELAAWWLRTLGLNGLENRLPEQLSGGQRQRVALARALSHGPRLLLLDEPFSALDAPVRDELRREMRRLQHETGLSTVLVTHDPEEAALLADEILIMAEGRLLQAGRRREVFDRPASPQVARLLGIKNINRATVTAPDVITVGGVLITVGTPDLPVGREVLWSIRPDNVAVTPRGAYAAVVDDVADIGTSTTVTVLLDGGPELRARTTDPGRLSPGDPCRVDLDPAAITLWPAGPLVLVDGYSRR